MSESGQRQRLIRAIKPLHPIPVENSVRAGTPDVNYAEGWIELKWLRSWPKQTSTPVRLPHFHQGQRQWLKARWRARGLAFLLLQCNKEWLLFRGPDAAEYVGNATRHELYSYCLVRWDNGLNNVELKKWLLKSWDELEASPLGNFSLLTASGAVKAKDRRRGA